jgi:hypothetical protein
MEKIMKNNRIIYILTFNKVEVGWGGYEEDLKTTLHDIML